MNIYALLAGLLSGIIGAMGLGGGAVLIIYLSVFTDTPQLKAQGINLIFFIPIAAVAVTVYAIKGKIKIKTVLPMAAGGLIGSFLGVALSGALGGEITSKIFGTGLLLLGVREVVCAVKQMKSKKEALEKRRKKCYNKDE